MQLLGSSKKVIDKNKDGEIAPRLETVEVVLVHCNLVNNNYQQASKVLFTFLPNKQFGQLITITPHSLTMLKTTNAEFSFIEIWFTGQNNRTLEIEDNVNITLLEQLKTGFKRPIKWNKYRSEMSNQTKNNNLSYLIDPTFTNVNRLFVFIFENEDDRSVMYQKLK